MLKVFLVEDEFVVREGIKNNVDWQSHGYEFCGEAGDGELAYPMIQKLRPDIVITDIRMPFMDGLTLSKLIKKELPWIEIIVLTGYGEFAYAKEAIKIGIAQYLLKPVNGNDLLKEMDIIADRIREKQKEREIREKYMREMEENFLKERKELFQILVSGSRTTAELLELGKRVDIDLSALWYNIILVKTQSTDRGYNEYSDNLVAIEQKLKELEEESGLITFDRNLEGKAILFKADSQEELEDLQRDYLEQMKGILNTYGHIQYFAGIGAAVSGLEELPYCFERANRAFAHRYLVSESTVFDSSQIESGIYLNKGEFNISDIDPRQLDRSKIQEFLKLGDKEETVYFVEEYFNDLGVDALKSNLFRQYITMDIYFCVCDFLESLRLERGEIEPLDEAPGALHSEENAIGYIIRIIEKALELREKTASGRYRDIVDEAVSYIESHYADEELSLNLLASHVNFSPNHLSMIFSQQTGRTFIRYLTDFRMNKAKELLRCTGKRSSEISGEIGYKDPHYFSYLFKKTQGMTPTQYRGKKS